MFRYNSMLPVKFQIILRLLVSLSRDMKSSNEMESCNTEVLSPLISSRYNIFLYWFSSWHGFSFLVGWMPEHEIVTLKFRDVMVGLFF